MKHKGKITVIDKKLYPELQQQFCADPNAGGLAPVITWGINLFLNMMKRKTYTPGYF